MQNLLLAEGAMISFNEKTETLSRWVSILGTENSRSRTPEEPDAGGKTLVAIAAE